MKKRIISALLAACMLLMAVPVTAGAATAQQVSAGTATVTAGNTVSLTLKAENFASVATVEVYLYYDPAVLSVSSTTNGSMLSGAQVSVNTAQEGTVKLVAMALNGISGTGNLLTVTFRAAADSTPGTYPISVAIGNAYGTDLSPVSIGSVNGSVTVNAAQETVQVFELNTYTSASTLRCGEVLTLQVASSYPTKPFVSGDFLIQYDPELFSFEALELESQMAADGAIYSVNCAVLGQVRLTYASTTPVDAFYLFNVKLKVTANTDATTTVTAQASNIYREDLRPYQPGKASKTLNLTYQAPEADHADAFLVSQPMSVGKQSTSTFLLQTGSGVAAADFTLTYDPAVLRCVAVAAQEALSGKGGMLVINDNFANGSIRFSYINMDAYDEEDLPLVTITWEPLCSPDTHYQIQCSGVGVVDPQQNAIALDYITGTGCIYRPIVTPSTCTEDGYTTYVCGCGDTYVADHTAALGHDIQPMDAKAPTCTEPGWDAHTACVRCGGEGNRVEIPALGHDFCPESTTAPSCTVGGYTTYICAACGASQTADATAPLGHDSIHHEGKTPTCKEPGWADYETCSRCNLNTYQDLPISDHNYMGKSCIFCGITRESTQQMDLSVDADGTVMAYIYENSDGTVFLEIAGNGPIKDYTSSPFSSFSGRIGDIYIADGITRIGNRLFYNAQTTGQLHIADTVTTIGDYAFSGISGPRWVSIPAGVTAIGNFAFYQAKGLVITLEGDTLPGSLGSIWDYNCGHYLNPQKVICTEDATYVIDSDGKAWLAKYCLDEEEFFPNASIEGIPVTGIGEYAFYGKTNMSTFTLPKQITDVKSSSFANCNRLVILTESTTKPSGLAYSSYDRPACYAAPQKVIQTEDFLYVVDQDGQLILARYDGSATDVTVPAEFDGLPLRQIGEHAFRSSTAQTVILPDTVEALGGYAFIYSSVRSIQLPESLTKIGTWCFFSGDLTSVTIPKNVSQIESSAFSYCSDLKTVYITSTAIAQMITSSSACGDLCAYAQTVVIPAGAENTYLPGAFTYSEQAMDYVIYSNCAHSWQETVVKEPGIGISGSKYSICSACGVRKDEILPALTVDGLVIKDAVMYLEKDLTLDALTVEAGKKLDLNGFTLSVSNLVCFGSLVDSSRANTGILKAEEMLLSDGASLPVYDAAVGGYRLLNYRLRSLGVREDPNGSVCFGFAIELSDPAHYSLLAAQDSGVSVTVQLSWGEEAHSFAFDAALLARYAALNAQATGLTPALMLTVSGLESVASGTQLHVQPGLTAASQLNLSWDTLSYTTPQ